ncbi:Oidioi.mRNA.OKI2018_I69.chr1.g1220.t1.cds [Oikopleura dioica]|uniref:Oidioi.mRNA.OKI2018_I69.chr1.g1220.t1.cds n=1 Tax=Oikopleura dioica TaxID=34765 RepID=A0ABN7SMS9_OIKDI|nr:Oidioi.mRNA.OKI2018_I69.chr1.g1220.t1.cds [Oikopleura dioica]
MRKVLVDCDPGVDDICALQFLFNRKDVEVVAITVVHGNCAASIGAKNALKLLTLNNLQQEFSGKIPVFVGSDAVLVAENQDWKKTPFHGKNGLCDVTENDVEIDESLIKPNAVQGICDLSAEFEGELEVLAIGPLTNLALAMTLDTNVAKKWKSLTIMGGTSWGSGNTTAAAEFNFYHDPEAAASVFAKMPALLVPKIVTWETTLKGQFLGEKINFHPDQKTTKGKWLWERCKKMGIFSKPLLPTFAFAISPPPQY